MKTKNTNSEAFNEQQLLHTLKTAVATSKKSLMEDGVLLICWGLGLSLSFFWKYYKSVVLLPSRLEDFMRIFYVLIGIGLIVFTIYFLFFREKGVRTHTAFSTRFVWLGVIIAHNLNVIVTKTFIAEVNFELIHPLQMVLIGFALFVTGGIYRYYILSISGIIMWIAAAVGSGYDLNIQFLVRALADFICFVIPGILMYSETKKHKNV